MKLYRIIVGFITLPVHSVIEMTYRQASKRLHAVEGHTLLNHGKNNDRRARYTLAKEAQFKAGEEIGYVGELPKTWGDRVVDLEAAAQAEKEAKEAAARADREAAQAAAAAELARTQHQALTVALANVVADANGNATIEDISKALAVAKLDFQPTDEQLNAAWSEVIAARAAHVAQQQ